MTINSDEGSIGSTPLLAGAISNKFPRPPSVIAVQHLSTERPVEVGRPASRYSTKLRITSPSPSRGVDGPSNMKLLSPETKHAGHTKDVATPNLSMARRTARGWSSSGQRGLIRSIVTGDDSQWDIRSEATLLSPAKLPTSKKIALKSRVVDIPTDKGSRMSEGIRRRLLAHTHIHERSISPDSRLRPERGKVGNETGTTAPIGKPLQDQRLLSSSSVGNRVYEKVILTDEDESPRKRSGVVRGTRDPRWDGDHSGIRNKSLLHPLENSPTAQYSSIRQGGMRSRSPNSGLGRQPSSPSDQRRQIRSHSDTEQLESQSRIAERTRAKRYEMRLDIPSRRVPSMSRQTKGRSYVHRESNDDENSFSERISTRSRRTRSEKIDSRIRPSCDYDNGYSDAHSRLVPGRQMNEDIRQNSRQNLSKIRDETLHSTSKCVLGQNTSMQRRWSSPDVALPSTLDEDGSSQGRSRVAKDELGLYLDGHSEESSVRSIPQFDGRKGSHGDSWTVKGPNDRHSLIMEDVAQSQSFTDRKTRDLELDLARLNGRVSTTKSSTGYVNGQLREDSLVASNNIKSRADEQLPATSSIGRLARLIFRESRRDTRGDSQLQKGNIDDDERGVHDTAPAKSSTVTKRLTVDRSSVSPAHGQDESDLKSPPIANRIHRLSDEAQPQKVNTFPLENMSSVAQGDHSPVLQNKSMRRGSGTLLPKDTPHHISTIHRVSESAPSTVVERTWRHGVSGTIACVEEPITNVQADTASTTNQDESKIAFGRRDAPEGVSKAKVIPRFALQVDDTSETCYGTDKGTSGAIGAPHPSRRVEDSLAPRRNEERTERMVPRQAAPTETVLARRMSSVNRQVSSSSFAKSQDVAVGRDILKQAHGQSDHAARSDMEQRNALDLPVNMLVAPSSQARRNACSEASPRLDIRTDIPASLLPVTSVAVANNFVELSTRPSSGIHSPTVVRIPIPPQVLQILPHPTIWDCSAYVRFGRVAVTLHGKHGN